MDQWAGCVLQNLYFKKKFNADLVIISYEVDLEVVVTFKKLLDSEKTILATTMFGCSVSFRYKWELHLY